MNKKIKTISIVLLILSTWACQRNKIKSPERIPDKEKLEQFDQLISVLMNDLSVDSFCYAICTNTGTLQLRENGIPAGQVIPIGDVSNMFISTLILQNSEKEKIDIKDNLGDYGVEGDMGKAQIKNLLSFTYNTTHTAIHYDPQNYILLSRALQTATGKKILKLFASGLQHKLKMKKTSIQCDNDKIQAYSNVNDLIRYSMAIDNQRLFKNESTNNLMFRPVYLETGERSPAGLGCYIEIADDKKIIWSEGQTADYATLFLKSAADSLSLILVAKSKIMNKAFDIENGELWNTPVYHAFRKTLLKNDSTGFSVNFYDDYPQIRTSIEKIFDTSDRDAIHDELISYLALYRVTNNSARFDSLAGIYKKFFPNDIPPDQLSRQPVSKIGKVMDYMRMNRTFSIPRDTVLNIFAVGEFTKEMSLSPWEYDNVEMFFDLNHERGTGFNSAADDRQYRFNYDFPSVTGNAPTFANITLVQYDVSPNRFNFEIAIPWTILFNSDTIHPEFQQIMGYDIAIADNDAEVREGSLAWQSTLNETPWSNTSTYGTMVLAKSPGPPNDTTCYALLKSRNIEMDGQNKGEWDVVPRYPIDKEFMAGITGPEDQSGWFRVQWDNENLYFLVEVQDDVKRLLDKNGDFGWITSANEDTVWIMTDANSIYAGGDPSNRYIKTTIPLKAGDYTLHYQTNQTHSYGHWTKKRPDISFYGILVY